jgi:hypothetical protein
MPKRKPPKTPKPLRQQRLGKLNPRTKEANAKIGWSTRLRNPHLIPTVIYEVWEGGGWRRKIAKGRNGRTLVALVEFANITALEVSSWAYRLATYIWHLRHGHGLNIKTLDEPHPNGTHGRYVLHSKVRILDVQVRNTAR